MNTDMTDVPAAFQEIFYGLVRAIQPRGQKPDTVAVYWTTLQKLPMRALRDSAVQLATSRHFPNTGDWFQAARAIDTRPRPIVGSRRLEELDGLALNDPERDEVCKNLSPADEQALMARYGYPWPGRPA